MANLASPLGVNFSTSSPKEITSKHVILNLGFYQYSNASDTHGVPKDNLCTTVKFFLQHCDHHSHNCQEYGFWPITAESASSHRVSTGDISGGLGMTPGPSRSPVHLHFCCLFSSGIHAALVFQFFGVYYYVAWFILYQWIITLKSQSGGKF